MIKLLSVLCLYIGLFIASGFFSRLLPSHKLTRFGIQSQLAGKTHLNLYSSNVKHASVIFSDEEEEESENSESTVEEVADLDEIDSPEMSIFKEGIHRSFESNDFP